LNREVRFSLAGFGTNVGEIPTHRQFLRPMPPRIPRTPARTKPKPNLRRRVQHLAFARQLPCVACGKAAPSEAAHVRTGTDSGVGIKPGDRYTVPLCSGCHARQHRIGELTFWSALRTDPSQCSFAAVDHVVRYNGWGAHCLSGATTDRSLEGIKPIEAREPRKNSSRRLTSGYSSEWC
jgi:hypothetical protein